MLDNKNYKILIVEDEPLLIQSLYLKLVQDNYQVLRADDGKQGLEIALKEHPDLILLDIVMPVMDGMEMLKNLRQDVWGKDAKVILLSNLSDSEKVAEAVSCGVYDYLTKTDWDLSEVLGKVKEYLK